MLGPFKQYISFAIRTLFKNKSFTITAVLTLALGIGATTAIFSVVYAVFEPMPYPNPDQLVMAWAKTPGGRNSVPAGDFLEWRRRSTSFQDMNAWTGASFNVATADRPNRLRAHVVRPASSVCEDCHSFSAATSFPKKVSLAAIMS